jgi:hypothetical protein
MDREASTTRPTTHPIDEPTSALRSASSGRRVSDPCSAAGRPAGILLAALAALAAVVTPAPARALSLAALSLEQLTADSDLVLRGRCIDRVPTHARGRIESVARFEVLDRFVGEAEPVVAVRQWGGRTDARQTIVPGAPLSEPGDEVVLFLAAEPDGSYRVVGVAQGYLPVVPSALATPVVRVSRTLGPEFASASAWPVERFAESVRRLARTR